MPLDILGFVRKWNASSLTEKSGAQSHFRDLCEALGVPHPTQEDEVGASYTFEKRVTKTGTTEQGFADVWKRGYFAWEYKSRGGDLNKAYKQLNEYHEALENPPLLVVCDFVRFEVHTKFENTPPRTYKFTLDDLLVARDTPTSALPPLDVLRHLFGDYNQLRPNVAAARVTEAAATDFLKLAQRLELERTAAPDRPSKEQIAHFLMRLVFCLFADSVGLLPNHAFRRLVTNDRFSPRGFNKKLPTLLEAMSTEGGFFGADNIPYFNGDLFRPNDHIIELDLADLGTLYNASQHDWSHIEPAIFGTLFERSLDAAKRSMIGAHYTSTDDILLLIEPVVMTPLRRRWETVQQSILAALAEENAPGIPEGSGGPSPLRGDPSSPVASSPAKVGRAAAAKRTQPTLQLNRPALHLLQDWAAELTHIRILDPACGSGNFLYVALKRLLDLWHEARVFGIAHGLTLSLDPIPNPGQLFGIEIDFYAHEIASIVVWIGFLQWKHDHGVKDDKEPLLRKLDNIQHADAIMRYDADDKPYEPEWPEAEYIIGNPPFLGDKLMRRELAIPSHPNYVDELRSIYVGRVPGGADLVTYWFEKARAELEANHSLRAGLLATQGIRGGLNRVVLEHIKQTGDIFWAYSDRDWTLNGATVHVSMVAFDKGQEAIHYLNGSQVDSIHANLSTGIDSTSAFELNENDQLCYIGTQKGGPFDITEDVARRMLAAPANPNGRPNSDVVVPWANARDVTHHSRRMFVIDFGLDMSKGTASLYELPFEYVKKHVLPKREDLRRANHRDRWWIHGEARPGFRGQLKGKLRYAATARHSKHRFFVWLDARVVPDSALAVVPREDDYFFGLVNSRAHELWSRSQGTQVREVESGFRYTPKSCFDTFPFPWPPGKEPTEADSPIVRAIADAARELVRLRDAWLNPPGASETDLKDRTLTKLYNARAEGKADWLANAHRTLDEAVFAAYGWPSTLTDQEILSRLLTLNHQRAAATIQPN